MNNEQMYDIAVWLVANKEYLDKLVSTGESLDHVEFMTDTIVTEFLLHHPKLDPVDVLEAFEDEKVKEVLDIYFFKKFYTQH